MNQPNETVPWSLVGALSFASGARILGLFLVLPVLSLHVGQVSGLTAWSLGWVLGVYGLSQMLCQVPMGVLSDRWGRKPVVLGGLCLLVLGSVVAARASHVVGLLVGRALQGTGAVSGVMMATLADWVPFGSRTRAMAVWGGCIGCAFVLAMVLAPMVDQHVGLQGVFWITAGLGAIAMLLLGWRLPAQDPPGMTVPLMQQLRDSDMGWSHPVWRLCGAVCLLHLFITATFVAVPRVLAHLQLTGAQQGWVYGVAVVGALVGVWPMIRRGEREQGMRYPMLALSLGVGMLACREATVAWITLALLCFFFGFHYLEASLPARAVSVAPARERGAAMALYAMGQFLGAFLGGVLGGSVMQYLGQTALFALLCAVGVVWCILEEKSVCHVASTK